MNHASVRSSLLLLVLVVVFASPAAFSQWSLSTATNNAISTAAFTQNYSKIASDGSGGAIITWMDIRNGSDADIYAQRIDASGVVQWDADGIVICTSEYYQSLPKIVSDGSGGALITWQDARNGSDLDIYAQHINADGIPLWDYNGVAISTATGDQQEPSIASDGAGGAIITWGDYRYSPSYPDIYTQSINADGVVQWTLNGIAVCSAPDGQTLSVITDDGSGGAIIAWLDLRNGAYTDVYAQCVNAAGLVQWASNGIPICTAAYDQLTLNIVSDGSGGAIMSWDDDRTGSTFDVYAQRVNASGVVQWTADGTPISTAARSQSTSVLAGDGSGGAIIAWRDNRSVVSQDIYAQRINASGTVQWMANGVPVSTAPEVQAFPTIDSDGFGGAIIAWIDLRNLVDQHVYAQRVNALGVAQWTANGVPVCTSINDRTLPVIVKDGSGGAIIAWEDDRSGTFKDIYAQRIDWTGRTFGLTPRIDHVGDIANDQGGKLRVFWQPSPLDTWGGTTVKSYTVKMGARSTGLFGKTSASVSSGIYWQTAGSVPADGSEGYTALLSTAADSGLQGTPYYYFQIIPIASDSSLYRPSNIDSAFSIDNIPPVGVGGTSISSSNNGTITLRWNKDKVDPDLMGYQVYRSSSTGFLLNEATKLAQTTDTAYADGATNIGTHYYYRVAAVDVHGNRGMASSELSIIALSIELSSFTANLNAHSGVQLEWQTATEIDNSGFGVERRANNSSSWNEIGFVAGNGTSNAPHTYSFVDRQVPAGHTAYRLRQVSSNGTSSYSFSVEMDVIPTTTTLSQNYPNPFNPSTEINYQLADGANVKLTVHDILGREVSSLVNGHQEPGLYQVRWDASYLPSGMYLYRLQTGSSTIARKMLLQK